MVRSVRVRAESPARSAVPAGRVVIKFNRTRSTHDRPPRSVVNRQSARDDARRCEASRRRFYARPVDRSSVGFLSTVYGAISDDRGFRPTDRRRCPAEQALDVSSGPRRPAGGTRPQQTGARPVTALSCRVVESPAVRIVSRSAAAVRSTDGQKDDTVYNKAADDRDLGLY